MVSLLAVALAFRLAVLISPGAGGEPDRYPSLRQAPAAQARLRTIGHANSVKLVPKRTNHCRLLAPADWQIAGARQQADAIDLLSGDGRSYAGWGIRAVNRQMQQYYGDQHGDPLQFSRFLVSAVSAQALGAPVQYRYTGREYRLGGGFVARELESVSHRAIVVFKLYPAPMGATYIISIRLAIAPKDAPQALHTATGVAAAINCVTQLIPRRNDAIELPRPGEPRRRSAGEADDLADYNPELGTQYVHSPSTGENYLVDRNAAWNENGPQGPGFYRQVGNSYEKLEAGRAPQ